MGGAFRFWIRLKRTTQLRGAKWLRPRRFRNEDEKGKSKRIARYHVSGSIGSRGHADDPANVHGLGKFAVGCYDRSADRSCHGTWCMVFDFQGINSDMKEEKS